jgi:hypothetical protein
VAAWGDYMSSYGGLQAICRLMWKSGQWSVVRNE